MKISNCEYWGTYDGYKVYKCYNRTAPNYSNIVFVIGTNLYMNGEVVGHVDSAGRVSGWAPERAKKMETTLVVEEKPVVAGSANADDILKAAMEKKIEDMIGVSLADWSGKKYSE